MRTNPIIFSKKKSYLYDFLKSALKKETKADIKFTNELYSYIKILVTKPPLDYIHKSDKNTFAFELPNWNDKDTTYNWYLSQNSISLIQKFIYEKLHLYFNNHMLECKKMQIKNAIYLFIELNNLSIDSFDMFKKSFYRYRREILQEKTKYITSRLVA